MFNFFTVFKGLQPGQEVGMSTSMKKVKLENTSSGIMVLTTDTFNNSFYTQVTEEYIKSGKLERISNVPDIIVIDEAHILSHPTELLFYITHTLVEKMGKSSPFIIITSASLDPDKCLKYFDVTKEKHFMNVKGKISKVKHTFLDVKLESKEIYRNIKKELFKFIDNNKEKEDVLIFASTKKMIEFFHSKLEQDLPSKLKKNEYEIFDFYGELAKSDKTLIDRLSKKSGDKFRVVIGTNAVETGVTIPNLGFVIELGVMNNVSFDPLNNAKIFISKFPIVKESSIQRCGRTGRIKEGTCLHLYSEEVYNSFQQYYPSELVRNENIDNYLKLLNLNSIIFGENKTINTFTPFSFAMETFYMKQIYMFGMFPNEFLSDLHGEFEKIPLECFNMIMSGIVYDVNLNDLITIAAFLITDFRINWKINKNIDEFIGILHIYDAILREKNLGMNKFYIDMSIIRNNILLYFFKNKINPSLGLKSYFEYLPADRNVYIKKIKKCIYEGFKLNLLIRRNDNEPFYYSLNGYMFKIPKFFTKDQDFSKLPRFVVTNSFKIKSKSVDNKIVFNFVPSFVCILDEIGIDLDEFNYRPAREIYDFSKVENKKIVLQKFEELLNIT